MESALKWLVAGTVGIVLTGAAVVAASLIPIGRSGARLDPTPSVLEPGEEGVPPRRHDAFVSVASTGAFMLDEVTILTGDPAHDAAVKAGVIAPDEDLPNDMWIDNPTRTLAQANVAEASIEMISGDDPGEVVLVTPEQFAALLEGSYAGPSIYGVAAGSPVLMHITFDGDVVGSLQQVYQP
ncbi:MAG: hypothetical protein OEX04_19210 [Acidimicrobiia bacterium]|nr:hypothetical protein [Acidimicrobiia bacterium]